MTAKLAKDLLIPQRGRVGRGYVADLILFEPEHFDVLEKGLRLGQPGTILIGGVDRESAIGRRLKRKPE
jgi:hypothetical protein